MNISLALFCGTVVAGYAAWYVLYSRYRWRQVNIPALVSREVEKREGTLVSIERTGLFDTGPFARVETSRPTRGKPVIASTAIPLGDRTFYKKVIWDDRHRTRRTSWIKLNFIPFYQLDDVTWKDEP